MKVLMINGSPNKHGATAAALDEIAAVLHREGIGTQIFHVPVNTPGCAGCMQCRKTGRCVIDDLVRTVSEAAETCDGMIVASPVYYGGMTGSLNAFLNRLFVSTGKKHFKLKPAAAVTVSRRLGNTTTFDAINKYFMVADMLIVSSNDWNEVHGVNYEEVHRDEEGRQTLRRMAQNIAYILRLRSMAAEMNIPEPEYEDKIRTPFIR